MKTILIIEDNISYAHVLTTILTAKLKVRPLHAMDYKSAQKILKEQSGEISIALIDFYLPDSDKGETIDLVNEYNIPAIVMTASLSENTLELIQSKKVFDYVIKEGPHSTDYLIAAVDRMFKNRNTKILVIDDSLTTQSHIRNLLEIHQYIVLDARNGKDALNILNSDSGIKVVLLDYNLPDTNGLALMRQIRASYPMNKLAIIGISGEENPNLSIKFLKEGANDFLTKPFLSEQLYCRITLNITILEQFNSLYDMSITDHLTKIYNRRYFFELAPKMFKNNLRQGAPFTVAMIDIDHFKIVNDTYGHMAGDTVLKSIAAVLKKSFRESDVIARYGGEEFSVFANNMKNEDAFRIFDNFRKKIENMKYKISDSDFNVTVSIGLCTEAMESLEDMIRSADNNLYTSKKTGRNKVTL